jgi:hypothetical protein
MRKDSQENGRYLFERYGTIGSIRLKKKKLRMLDRESYVETLRCIYLFLKIPKF